jgi:flagellar hook-associated protein 2
MTSTINFSGLGSGIDFSKITDAVVAERQRPVTLLQNKSADYNARISSLKQLNGLLINLKKAASDLTQRDLGSGHTALSTDFSIVNPTAAATAANGAVSLQVTRLASNLVEASHSFNAETDVVLPDGVTSATFELRKGGASSGIPITINSDNNSLKGLRDAINAADAGVTAAIVDVTGGGARQLVVTSKETGASGRVELVETSATGTLTDLSLRRLDSSPDALDFSNLDAQLSVNGLVMTRPTNTVADAIVGLTFDLKKTGSATITISNNSSDITAKLQTLVAAYNAVQDFVASQYKADTSGRPVGVLAGEQTLRSVQQQLRDALSAVSGDNGGTLKSLAEVGLGRDANGKLTLDQTVLSDKLKNSLEDMRDLLFGKTETQSGLASGLDKILGSLSDETNGTVQTAINGYKSSLNSIQKSITNQTAMIDALRASLSRQFSAMDAAMGQLNSQSTTLTTILKSLQTSGNSSSNS